jgi:hypothetical protein
MKDPLRAFKENYNKRRLISADVEVRERKQRVQQYFDELDIETNVHILWILTWISTLNYQDDYEKPFRLKQVIEVIRRINAKNVKLNLEIFELLMDSCDKYGSLKMVLEIYD